MAQDSTRTAPHPLFAPASGLPNASAPAPIIDGSAALRSLDQPGVRHRVLLLYERSPGRRPLRQFRENLRALVAGGCDVAVREIDGVDEAESYLRQACEFGFEAVVVAGGHAVVAAAISAVGGTAILLAVLPLAKSPLARRRHIAAESAALAEAMQAGDLRRIPLARVANRSFSTCAAVGLPQAALPSPATRRKAGVWQLRLLWGVIRHAMRRHPHGYNLAIDDRIEVAAAVVIAPDPNALGIRVVGVARDDADHRLWICLCPKTGHWNAVRYAFALAFDRLPRLPDAIVLRARTVSITGPVGGTLYADGAIAGTLPAQARITNSWLNIIPHD